jgi:hypothetical protein
MSFVFILDAARTIALGGVATGNMKAYEQHRVAGIMKYRGWIFIATACKNQDIGYRQLNSLHTPHH